MAQIKHVLYRFCKTVVFETTYMYGNFINRSVERILWSLQISFQNMLLEI